MSELKDFVVLQARLYEFLAQQDEATLQAIAGGTAQLAVVGAAPAPAAPPATPSSDPLQATQDLLKLPSADERRGYLHAAKLSVVSLRKVARSLDLRGYSGLTRGRLIDLLAGHGSDSPSDRPEVATPEPPPPASNGKPTAAPPAARSDVDVSAVATHLRETETEEEGAAYLEQQHLDRDSLLAVAAELQLTRVERLSQKELTRRVLKQAIGARRKFAGLRKW